MRRLSCMLLSAALVLSIEARGVPEAASGVTAKAKKPMVCLFPDSRARAPDWMCEARTDGLAMTAVGSAAKSGAGNSFMEQMAAADARAHLAQDLRSSVQSKIRAGRSAANKKDIDRDGALITRIANDSLAGTKIMRSAYGPDGTLYVQIGLDGKTARRLVRSITAEYLRQKQKH